MVAHATILVVVGLLRAVDRWTGADRRATEQRDRLLDLIQLPTLLGVTPGGTRFIVPAPPTSVAPLAVSAAWRCVTLIADAVAGLPVHAYRAGRRITPPTLVSRPDPTMPASRFWRRVTVDLLVRGNALLMVSRRAATGWPLDVIHVPWAWVRTTVRDGQIVEWRVGDRVLDPADLLWVPFLEVDGSPVGVGPVDAARHTLETAGYQAERSLALNRDDGSVPLVITTERGLTAQQVADVKAQWMAAHHRGSQEPAVLAPGFDIKTFGFSPEQVQFLESRRFTVAEIARFFGVPPFMINADASRSETYSNVEQESINFVRWTLDPILVRLEDGLSELLPRDTRVRFDREALLRADARSRAEIWAAALRDGWMTVDEVRSFENLPIGEQLVTEEVER